MRRWGLFAVGVPVAAVLAASAVSPARAADMALPAYNPPAAAMPPAHYDWGGFYFGGNVGVGLLRDNINPLALGAGPPTNPVSGTNLSPTGIVGGAQVGVNFQWAAWVIGAEAAWDATNLSGSSTVGLTNSVIPGATGERMTSNPQWFASVTGRVGYAANDLLFYVKGGGARMNVNYTQDILSPAGVPSTQTIGDHRTGFTAGAGIEYGLTEALSARLEYDFYDFGTQNYAGFTQTPVSVKSDLHTLTFALNYRFNWHWPSERCPTC